MKFELIWGVVLCSTKMTSPWMRDDSSSPSVATQDYNGMVDEQGTSVDDAARYLDEFIEK